MSINKLVIGKPGSAADATNGFMDPATLGTCVAQAKAQGWNAGIMAFEVRSLLFALWGADADALLLCSQFPEADSTWISAAKGGAFQ